MHGSGVYMILDTVSGRRYIGSAVRLWNRRRQHFQSLARGDHHSRFMQKTWNKRPEALEFSIVLYCDKDNLLMYEQLLLDAYKPEFNTAPVAGSQLGLKMSDEARAKMRKARRKDFSPMTGKKHTDETKAKISKTKSGVPAKAEHVAKRMAAIKALPIPPGPRKLSFNEVREIRDLCKHKVMTQIKIGLAYGVSNSVVCEINSRKSYGWMTDG